LGLSPVAAPLYFDHTGRRLFMVGVENSSSVWQQVSLELTN
jgi:hypothetical protein